MKCCASLELLVMADGGTGKVVGGGWGLGGDGVPASEVQLG